MNEEDLARELSEHARDLRRINRITLVLVLLALASVAYNANREPAEKPAAAPTKPAATPPAQRTKPGVMARATQEAEHG